MDKVIFEHPLNEKMRILLRIEFLLSLIYVNSECTEANSLSFFHALSELLDIIDRNHIRTELIKELESQKRKLINSTGKTQLSDEKGRLLEKLKSYSAHLLKTHKLGSELKNDRFISSIRQRLSIPGGCCNFDLPALHFWLSLPQEQRDAQVKGWLTHLSIISEVLGTCLQLTRELGKFEPYSCDGHFIQSAPTDVNLIRIRLALGDNIYPQVSGHISRYSIRFLQFGVYDNKSNSVEFDVANC